MNRTLAIGIGGLMLVVLMLFSMSYSVSYHEVAVRTRFGKADENSIVRDAGLHFRMPFFADSVTAIDTRMQLVESPLENLQTADGQQIVVRAFLLWRIDTESDGPLAFHRAYASVEEANAAIQDRFRDAISALGAYRLDELLGPGNQLAEAEESILARLETMRTTGMLPVTVGVSQVMLPAKITTAVLSRMQAQRDTLADNERARGMAEAERIRSEATEKAERIRAFASQRAEEIRATGEARAAQYLEQMSEDEDLAIFLIWLDALEQSLAQNTTLILETGLPPWHLMSSSGTSDERGIPQPAEQYLEGVEFGGDD